MRHHGYTITAALHRFDQRAESTIAGEQHNLFDVLSELHRIHRELNGVWSKN
jgi:hypothetical protein